MEHELYSVTVAVYLDPPEVMTVTISLIFHSDPLGEKKSAQRLNNLLRLYVYLALIIKITLILLLDAYCYYSLSGLGKLFAFPVTSRPYLPIVEKD